MRLLEIKTLCEFSLTKDLIDNIPPYAILSHTWGDDEEEVAFNDLAIGAGRVRLDIKRSNYAQSKPLVMAYSISGGILVVLINRTTSSSQRLSTLCFGGIEMRPNVTYICQMFRQMTTIRTTYPSSLGNRLLGKADGLPGARHYKSLLLRL
jgi:hypothetical protein